MSLKPEQVVASFDSASVLHASLVAALEHQHFANLGNSDLLGTAVRVAGRLPWPILKPIYSRIGGAEGIAPDRLGEVDMGDVATSFASAYGPGPFPGVFIGSSNGALTHLAAALGMPWLPGTVLVPVHHVGDPQRPDQALRFGADVAGPLLESNPGIVLHQMHDAAQDELMTARMAYFRTKWSTLPAAYANFLAQNLAPGAPVILVEDKSTWPVTRIGERHVFQNGGRGGLEPERYQQRQHAPKADDVSREAEWGSDPEFNNAVQAWCAANSRELVRIRVDGPQEASHPVAETLRQWIVGRGGAGDRLLVPSFVLGDPWRTIELGRVPFWTFFPVRSALQSLEYHLAHTEPYRDVSVLLFQHGAKSPGLATPADIETSVRAAGAEPRMLAVRPDVSPRDIGSLGRYNSVLAKEEAEQLPFTPLPVADALGSLRLVLSERQRTLVEPPARA